MRLSSLSVENFRSITKASKIEIGNSTILVGPNNEGKSNILRGLAVAFEILERPWLFGVSPNITFGNAADYEWKRDFPVHLQQKTPGGHSIFTLEFQLTQDEVRQLKDETGLRTDRSLIVQLNVGHQSVDISVLSPPKANHKRHRVASFIAKRIMLDYIPSIRTAEKATAVVSRTLERELRTLESNPEYQAALKQLAAIQQPVLEAVSQSVKATMIDFLPAIKDVNVRITDEQRSRALRRSAQVIVNDGTATDLKHKGDGVQSLAALALMRHAAESNSSGKSLIIAVEEPESHLHPKAMHSLKAVLGELAEKHQVVITTHSPIFVNRDAVSRNIVVNANEAKSAGSVEEIREILGVVPSDNLRHAEVVLLVEGYEDHVALPPLLSFHSGKLRNSFATGKLVVDSLNGGSNLSYKVGLVKDTMLCKCHAFMDGDSQGKSAFEKAALQGLLSPADVNFAQAIDMKAESEIEDLYDPEFYRNLIWNSYAVDIHKSKDFKKKNKKWSARLESAFREAGKPWNDRILAGIKSQVANLVAADPEHALFEHRRPVIENLITTLETKVGR
jgi:putative ATP-dependent endonuclease of the OLD family